jgi:hypothetical protein
MLPPLVHGCSPPDLFRLIRSAWSIGSMARRLAIAALGFDLLLHGTGVA